MCDNEDDLADGSCSGLGYCQTPISKEVWRVEVTLKSYENLIIVAMVFLLRKVNSGFIRENFPV